MSQIQSKQPTTLEINVCETFKTEGSFVRKKKWWEPFEGLMIPIEIEPETSVEKYGQVFYARPPTNLSLGAYNKPLCI